MLGHRFEVAIRKAESLCRWRWYLQKRRQNNTASSAPVPRWFDPYEMSLTVHLGALALLVLTAACMSVAQSSQLPSAWQQKKIANAFSKQRTVPHVDHGYIVSFRPRMAKDGGSNIFVSSLATGEEQSITFWINGASEIRAEDVAVNTGGQIYIAGSLMRTGEVSLTNFVAEVDRTGTATRVFDLGSFTPKRMCPANDGTFWVFGLSLGGGGDDGHGERLLRQYSTEGHLLNAYLPSNKFPSLSRYGFGRAAVTLACGDESVGVYIARPARWIEVQFSNPVAYKWRIQPAPPGRVTGVVLMGTHQLYATFATRVVGADGKRDVSSMMYRLNIPASEQASPLLQLAGPSGSDLSLSKLPAGSRPKGSWTPLPDGSDTAAGKVFLLGRDDQSLVYVGPRVASADPTFYWVRP